MDAEKFIYVTYIASTPAKVWKALTDGELTSPVLEAHERV